MGRSSRPGNAAHRGTWVAVVPAVRTSATQTAPTSLVITSTTTTTSPVGGARTTTARRSRTTTSQTISPSPFAVAVAVEISYNALIEDNSFVDGGWGAGACGAAPGNPCYTSRNLDPPVYISESGGNSELVGHADGIYTITISGDDFETTGTELSCTRAQTASAAPPTTRRPDTARSFLARLPAGAEAAPPQPRRTTPMTPTPPGGAGKWT